MKNQVIIQTPKNPASIIAHISVSASARNFKSGAEMAEAREAMLKYFCDQYRMMLEDNLDDHINNFSQYMLVK